jgi:hypothetical protein
MQGDGADGMRGGDEFSLNIPPVSALIVKAER